MVKMVGLANEMVDDADKEEFWEEYHLDELVDD